MMIVMMIGVSKCHSTCIETYTSSTVLPKKGGDPENDNDIGGVE